MKKRMTVMLSLCLSLLLLLSACASGGNTAKKCGKSRGRVGGKYAECPE